MGQQQLLLLVLGIVIVGLAVVVGIQAFSENQKKANGDAIVNDAIRIASDIQAWKLKPQAFGGGADQADFTGVTLSQIGYSLDSGGDYSNLNGTFEFDGTPGATVTIKGTNTQTDNAAKVVISGTTPDAITTTVFTAVGDYQ
jgi:hypothetical protein